MNIWNNDVCAVHGEIEENKEEYFVDAIEFSEDDVTDQMIWDRAYEEIQDNLDSEVANLDFNLNGEIVLVGTMVRWNGSFSAYHECKTNNVGDAIMNAIESFDGDNMFSIDVSEGKMTLSQTGHDNSTNPSVFEFREMTESLDDLDDYSTATIIANSKPIANYVCDVYGWEYDVA